MIDELYKEVYEEAYKEARKWLKESEFIGKPFEFRTRYNTAMDYISIYCIVKSGPEWNKEEMVYYLTHPDENQYKTVERCAEKLNKARM